MPVGMFRPGIGKFTNMKFEVGWEQKAEGIKLSPDIRVVVQICM